MQLWQIYLNNVDVLLKVLHVPTTQPVIFAAINNPSEAPADVSALLFSICFAAITTLDTEQIEFTIGFSRQSAIEIYQRGLEISLHNASFLDSPTIKSLQAMAIYLVSFSEWKFISIVDFEMYANDFHYSRCALDNIMAVAPGPPGV